MLSGPRSAKSAIALLGFTATLLGGGVFYATAPHHISAPPESGEGLLKRADTLSWSNNWADAKPLYAKAQTIFEGRHELSKALYAKVSQEPPNEMLSVQSKILALTQALHEAGAQDPETRLRILTIRGMFETNYDAAQANATWRQVKSLALELHHFELASRAEGEQGIAAFISGDTDTAKRQVITAWELSKLERDYAATVRYASVFGAGLVQMGRYKEALTPLNQAITLSTKHLEIAYPTIAVYAKIDALTGLQQYGDALDLANHSLERLRGTPYAAHESQVLVSRGSIYRREGNWRAAIEDYKRVVLISQEIDSYRGVTDGGGLLAQAYEQTGDLQEALSAINTAIEANTHIPDELYLAPRNLAIKAEITARMGQTRQSDMLYRKGITLVDDMLQHSSTTNIQRQLLAEMSDLYSGYVAFLSANRHYDEALQALEQVRGRLEAEALEHHATQSVHAPTPEEQELTKLNVALINTDDPAKREKLTSAIYDTELRLSPSALTQQTIEHPVHLAELQKDLRTTELVIEYVLAEPTSYAFAITRTSASTYSLPAKSAIEADVTRYRKEIRAQKEDRPLAHQLFAELVQPMKEYTERANLVIVPDGALHLLPWSALVDPNGYVLKSHTVDVVASSTVFDLLSKRAESREPAALPYIGVAAWTQSPDKRAKIMRAMDGPERSELIPLPDSKREVETIAADLPGPSAILLGPDATESRFKKISPEGTDVIHLALHGYADLDYPDRSALVFAPDPSSSEDGLLQAREIRALPLKAKLVTLSACNTGVGPVGQTGVANVVNAFIEAGADSVVSTLWELEDHTTARLMASFYGQLAKHKSKVDALRSAQLELLDDGLPPYYWASFQIVGDPNGTV